MFQVLETVDSLVFEGDSQENVYAIVVCLLNYLNDVSTPISMQHVRQQLHLIVELLGFQPESTEPQPITTLIEELTSRKMKSFDYLTVS